MLHCSAQNPCRSEFQYTFCPISNHNRQLLLPSLCQFNSVKSTQRGNSIDFCHHHIFNYFWGHKGWLKSELNYFLSHRCVCISLKNWVPNSANIFFTLKNYQHIDIYIYREVCTIKNMFSKNCNLRIGLTFC